MFSLGSLTIVVAWRREGLFWRIGAWIVVVLFWSNLKMAQDKPCDDYEEMGDEDNLPIEHHTALLISARA
jgi:hypothetical protein